MRLAGFAITVMCALGASCSSQLESMRGALRGSSGGGKNQGSPAPTSTSTSTQSGTPDEAPADGGETPGEPDPDGAAEGDRVGFDLVQPILETYCTKCHNPTGDNPDLTSYSRARIVGQHIVRTSATDIPAMPLGPDKLSEDEKKILRAWRAGGFAE